MKEVAVNVEAHKMKEAVEQLESEARGAPVWPRSPRSCQPAERLFRIHSIDGRRPHAHQRTHAHAQMQGGTGLTCRGAAAGLSWTA